MQQTTSVPKIILQLMPRACHSKYLWFYKLQHIVVLPVLQIQQMVIKDNDHYPILQESGGGWRKDEARTAARVSDGGV